MFEFIKRTRARDTYRHTPPRPAMQTGGVADNLGLRLLSGPEISIPSASERPSVAVSRSRTIETSGESTPAVRKRASLEGRIGASFRITTNAPAGAEQSIYHKRSSIASRVVSAQHHCKAQLPRPITATGRGSLAQLAARRKATSSCATGAMNAEAPLELFQSKARSTVSRCLHPGARRRSSIFRTGALTARSG
jgi:hypothetical protein